MSQIICVFGVARNKIFYDFFYKFNACTKYGLGNKSTTAILIIIIFLGEEE